MPTSTNVTNLKINELTEAQYDTAVQGGVIGANELSVITDASPVSVNTTVTLAAADWSAGTQTVTVNGITATSVVWVSPDPSDQADYVAGGILCTAQAANSLTFTASTTPTNDIDVVVVAM